MRNSQQLQAAIEKQEQIVRTATSEMTRNYARERISYLRGELMLQREYERASMDEGMSYGDSRCRVCGGRQWAHGVKSGSMDMRHPFVG